MPPMKLLAVLLSLTALTPLTARATAADTTAPTCEIVRSSVINSTRYTGGFRFTLYLDATDNAALQTYTGAKGPFEYRARVAGGSFGPWSVWLLDYSQPLYFDVICTEFHVEVRSVDAAGNRSATVAKDFFAPFALEKNSPKATFGLARNFTTGGSTAHRIIAGADFDGDTHPDVVQADHDTGIVHVLRNTAGTGKAFVATDLTFLANSVDDVASGQFGAAAGTGNNDALPDLAVASNAGIIVELNQGVGTNGALTFSAQSPITVADHYLQHIAVADLNGDGYPDIAATASASATAADPAAKVAVFLNNGSAGGFAAGVLYNVGTFLRDIVLGDLNGDGKADIAVADSYSVNVRLNNGDGTFGSAVNHYPFNSPHRLALADLSGDGKREIIATTEAVYALSNGLAHHVLRVEILVNEGAGNFTERYSRTVSTADLATPQTYDCAVAVGDLNGDGKADIITGSTLSKTVTILHLQPLKNSAGKFLTLLYRGKSTALSGGPVRSLALAELNGRGRADIVLSNSNATRPTSVLLNTTP